MSISTKRAQLIDGVSSVFSSFYGMANFIYPIIGSYMTEKLGFSSAMDLVGLVFTLSSAVYMSFTLYDV